VLTCPILRHQTARERAAQRANRRDHVDILTTSRSEVRSGHLEGSSSASLPSTSRFILPEGPIQLAAGVRITDYLARSIQEGGACAGIPHRARGDHVGTRQGSKALADTGRLGESRSEFEDCLHAAGDSVIRVQQSAGDESCYIP
jgi:hypothetical protein